MHDCYQAGSPRSPLVADFFTRTGVRVLVVTNESSPIRYLNGVVEHGIVPDTKMLYVDMQSQTYVASGATGLSNLKDAIFDAAKSGRRWKDTIDKTHGNLSAGVSRNGSALIALQMQESTHDATSSEGKQAVAAFYQQEFSFLHTPLGEAVQALGALPEECAQVESIMLKAREMLGVDY